MRRFIPKPQSKSICLVLALVGAILVALGVMMIVLPEPVLAYSSDLTAAVNQYPQIDNTDLDSCSLCHGNGSSLNPYGSDYDIYGFAASENIDSDGDGFLNIDEVNALTQPGDATDYPPHDTLAIIKYPALAGTALDSCDLCHSSGTSLNSYGIAYNSAGGNLDAFDLIEADDSDGDTFSNITEINGLTFPGDENDHPVQVNEDIDRARTKYPAIIGGRLDSCLLCHTDPSPTPAAYALNVYGAAYDSAGRNLAAFDTIADNNSDGDAFSNIEEITDLKFPGDAGDYPHDNFLVIKAYPDLDDSRLDSCDLCHSSGSALNSYGAAYSSAGRDLAAFGDIEEDDSDSDTFTNLEEIIDFKFPGDPNDYPVAATDDMTLAVEKYPTIELTDLNSCILCHTNNNPTGSDHDLNSYGTAYDSAGRNLAAFDLIQNNDSDNDDFTNLEEIIQLTFPGDAADPHDDARVLKQYSYLAGTALDSCTMCHNSDYTLNSYGAAYDSAGRNLSALAAIEGDDSDNDDFTNLEEIQSVPPTFPGNAADPHDDARVLKQYSHLAGTDLDSCDLCHSSIPNLNPYGAAYNTAGRNLAALIAIEDDDADQDAYTNLEEIQADPPTFPGDPFDYPPHGNDLYLSQYPQLAGTRLDTCLLCHNSTNGTGGLNLYGSDYKNAGNNPAAFVTIETLDSDDDGYLNLAEIEALTFPGNPTDIPSQSGGSNTVFLPLILK